MGNELVVIVGLVLAASVVVLVVSRSRRRPPDPSARTGVPGAAPEGRGPGGGSAGAGTDDGAGTPSTPPSRAAGAAPVSGDHRDAPAAAPTGPASSRSEAPTSGSLASLLAGITLPCGLAPHVAADHPDPDRYVALATTGASPSEVARAMTAELERLGFEVHGLSEDDLVARRDDDLMSVRVHPRADVAQRGGTVLFPGAPPAAVMVELWVGAGPSPREV